jgi:hypothetical protein
MPCHFGLGLNRDFSFQPLAEACGSRICDGCSNRQGLRGVAHDTLLPTITLQYVARQTPGVFCIATNPRRLELNSPLHFVSWRLPNTSS